ncbi:MAG: hypothetical protein WC330_07825, partial [Candidatus Omnitrophota bacterium]
MDNGKLWGDESKAYASGLPSSWGKTSLSDSGSAAGKPAYVTVKVSKAELDAKMGSGWNAGLDYAVRTDLADGKEYYYFAAKGPSVMNWVEAKMRTLNSTGDDVNVKWYDAAAGKWVDGVIEGGGAGSDWFKSDMGEVLSDAQQGRNPLRFISTSDVGINAVNFGITANGQIYYTKASYLEPYAIALSVQNPTDYATNRFLTSVMASNDYAQQVHKNVGEMVGTAVVAIGLYLIPEPTSKAGAVGSTAIALNSARTVFSFGKLAYSTIALTRDALVAYHTWGLVSSGFVSISELIQNGSVDPLSFTNAYVWGGRIGAALNLGGAALGATSSPAAAGATPQVVKWSLSAATARETLAKVATVEFAKDAAKWAGTRGLGLTAGNLALGNTLAYTYTGKPLSVTDNLLLAGYTLGTAGLARTAGVFNEAYSARLATQLGIERSGLYAAIPEAISGATRWGLVNTTILNQATIAATGLRAGQNGNAHIASFNQNLGFYGLGFVSGGISRLAQASYISSSNIFNQAAKSPVFSNGTFNSGRFYSTMGIMGSRALDVGAFGGMFGAQQYSYLSHKSGQNISGLEFVKGTLNNYGTSFSEGIKIGAALGGVGFIAKGLTYTYGSKLLSGVSTFASNHPVWATGILATSGYGVKLATVGFNRDENGQASAMGELSDWRTHAFLAPAYLFGGYRAIRTLDSSFFALTVRPSIQRMAAGAATGA